MFFQVLSAIGTAISVMSAMQAGRAAREQAEAQAAEIEEERITNRIRALQTTNNMLAEYDADTNINEAMLFGQRLNISYAPISLRFEMLSLHIFAR